MKIENLNSLLGTKLDKLDEVIYISPNPKNSTVKWLGSDSEAAFKRLVNIPNLSGERQKKAQYWKDKEINYDFNNYGFRTPDDFDFEKGEKGILTLGCSFTEGLGLPLEYIWGYKLAKELGLKYYTCALGGQGLHTAFRMLLYFGRRLNVDDIFLLVPPKGRIEHIIHDNELFKSFLRVKPKYAFNSGMGNEDYINHTFLRFADPELAKILYAYHFGSNLQIDLNELIYLFAIKQLAASLGKNIYIHTAYRFGKKEYKEQAMKAVTPSMCKEIPARDGHFPSTIQHWIFENFLQDYYEVNQRRTL